MSEESTPSVNLTMHCHHHQNHKVFTQHLSPNCNQLPEELIIDILLRLPVRSLHQLKCICKLWKTLISDPQFIKRHLQISNAEPSLTHLRLYFSHLGDTKRILYYPLYLLFQNLLPRPVSFSHLVKPRYDIIGSCNGLLCLFHSIKNIVRLCNPSIMFKSKKSPKLISPSTCMIMQMGFGYDQVNDKYKALVVAQNKDDSTQSLTKIYTFGEDSWNTIPNPLTPIKTFSLLGKFVNGTLNWIAEKEAVIVILSFNLEKETYKKILLPQDDGDEVYIETLYVLNNCLGVCYETNQTHWVAWLMKEHGVIDSWTKFITIPLEKFIMTASFVFPMFISENGLVLLMNIYTSQLLLYNINSGEFLESLESGNTLRFNLHICCESLVSVPW